MANMKYKLRVYIASGERKGEIHHEEFFESKKQMNARYKELFLFELYSVNPTAWVNAGGWIRLAGY